jgi:acylphosphatase
MNGKSEQRCVLARILGRVQGVWYRAWTEETARRLGLRGWVRNRRDGSVEALFCGAPADVERMLELARSGPPAARVERIEVSEVADPPAEEGFHIRPTV